MGTNQPTTSTGIPSPSPAGRLNSPKTSYLAWSVVGHAGYSIAQWVILTLLARWREPRDVGLFALAFSLVAPLTMLLNMRLRLVLSADTGREFGFATYMRVRITTAVMIVAVAVLMGFASPVGTRFFYVITAVGLAKALESISDIVYGLFQRDGRADLVGRSMLLRGIAAISFVVVGASLGFGVVGLSLCLAFGWGLILVFFDLPKARWLGWRTPESVAGVRTRALSLVRMAAVLGLVACLGSLESNVSRYFIDHLGSAAQLGFYAAAAYLATAESICAAALGQPFLRQLGHAASQGDRAGFSLVMRKLALVGVGLGGLGVVGALLFGELVLAGLYGDAYAARAGVLVLLMIAAGIRNLALFLWYALTVLRRLSIQIMIGAISVVVICAWCWFRIPVVGIRGAAEAEILGLSVNLCLSLIVYLRRLRFLHRGRNPMNAAEAG